MEFSKRSPASKDRLFRAILACIFAGLMAFPAAADSRRVLLLSLGDRGERVSIPLAAQLAGSGIALTRAAPASPKALLDSVTGYEAKLARGDASLIYIAGAAYHTGSVAYVPAARWTLCLDALFRDLDAREGRVTPRSRYMVLDLCGAGGRPLQSCFEAGVGEFLDPPPGTSVLVPTSDGRAMTPDDDESDLVAASFAEAAAALAADPLALFRSMVASLARTSSGRLGCHIFGPFLLSAPPNATSLWGLRVGMGLAEALRALGRSAEAVDPGKPIETGELTWTPQADKKPAMLGVDAASLFAPGCKVGSDKDAAVMLRLSFLDGLLQKIELSEAQVNSAAPLRSEPLLRYESLYRQLLGILIGSSAQVWKPFKCKETVDYAAIGSMVGTESVIDSYYFTQADNAIESDLFLQGGLKIGLELSKNYAKFISTESGKLKADTYFEYLFSLSLMSDAAKE